MKDFFGWIKEQNETTPYFGSSPTAGSDEVIRTGKQPQVGSEFEAKNKDNLSSDSLGAIDGQIQRLNTILQDVCNKDKVPACNDLMNGFQQFLQAYQKIKNQNNTMPSDEEPTLPNMVPTDKQRSMMQAEQPPRSFLPPIGGGVSDYTNTM